MLVGFGTLIVFWTQCRPLPDVDRDDALLEGRGWVEIARYQGSFSVGPDKDGFGEAQCRFGFEAVCREGTAGRLVLEGWPVAVECETTAFTLHISTRPDDPEDPRPDWHCGQDHGLDHPKGPTILAGVWGAFDLFPNWVIPERHPKPGRKVNGTWDARFLAWAGPWREPICRKPESAIPRGGWSSCVGEEAAPGERMTHRSSFGPYFGGG